MKRLMIFGLALMFLFTVSAFEQVMATMLPGASAQKEQTGPATVEKSEVKKVKKDKKTKKGMPEEEKAPAPAVQKK